LPSIERALSLLAMQKAPGTFDPVAEPDGDSSAASGREPGAAPGAPAVSASHEILFQASEPETCDACGGPLPEGSDDDDVYELPGSAVYMWTRGDSVRFERAPLCAACAAAIGMAALFRWEIEEEEG
jgi:hypothetical protein